MMVLHNPRIYANSDRYKEVVTVKSKKRTRRESFALPLPPVLLLGGGLAITFFGLIVTGPLDTELLRRYCMSHPVAVASVSLFFVGLVTLSMKWFQAFRQTAVTNKSAAALQRMATDGDDVSPASRPEWLLANWQALPASTQASWIGERVAKIVALQISRGRRHQLETDLRQTAEADADRQHDSYSLLRIINWAMPMLGFLGTVLGISQTLGKLDTKMLASQQDEAMNQLTAGLYVAFDTTAIALVLTVFLMFLQFAVSRMELRLLGTIDSEVDSALIEFLAADPYDANDSLLSPIREVAEQLLTTVRQSVAEQAGIWSRSIEESQRQWANWTQSASERIESDLGDKIGASLNKHVADLERLQGESYRQVDSRWKQWQTTLSDQARVVQVQQKEIADQSSTLHKLVDATTELRKLEETIHDSVSRLENVNRLEQASQCVGEAVAVLATSLERAGIIRGAPIKPRVAKSTMAVQDSSGVADPQPEASTSSPLAEPDEDILPLDAKRRKAA